MGLGRRKKRLKANKKAKSERNKSAWEKRWCPTHERPKANGPSAFLFLRNRFFARCQALARPSQSPLTKPFSKRFPKSLRPTKPSFRKKRFYIDEKHLPMRLPKHFQKRLFSLTDESRLLKVSLTNARHSHNPRPRTHTQHTGLQQPQEQEGQQNGMTTWRHFRNMNEAQVEANPGRVNDRDKAYGGYTPLYVAACTFESLPLTVWLLDEKGLEECPVVIGGVKENASGH